MLDLPVYVDSARHRFGRMIMCHLWSDTLDELFAMVDVIGVQRKWIQGHPTLSLPNARDASWLHFDISLVKKLRAIRAGAILTDKYGPLEHVALLQIASGDPAQIATGERRLRQIGACRTMDAEAARRRAR